MDIDIDVPTQFDPVKIFKTKFVLASRVENELLTKHNCGIYFQNMATDPMTGFAAIPYKEAEKLDYFKIDLISNSTLSYFESKQWMDEWVDKEPDWNLLLERENVEKLFQLSKKFDFVYAVKPKSVKELADVVALIRPDKQQLLDKYLRNKKEMRKELYMHRSSKDMRKSHATAYALLIVLQLHLIKMGKL